MSANPYNPRSAPRALVGRDAEVSMFQQTLAEVEFSRHAAQGGVVLYGVRGVGKTSTLRAVEDVAVETGFVPVWISAAKNESIFDSLMPTIRTSLENYGVVPRGKWTPEEVGIELNFGIVKAKGVSRRKHDSAPGPWSVGSVERLIREAARTAGEHGGGRGGGLILFVDELHAVRDNELAILSNALQNIAHDRRHSPPFAFFAAGLPSIRGLATRAATFGERTEFIKIANLDNAAAAKAIAEPARSGGVGYDDDALARLADPTFGYPYFVQLFGFHTWKAANPAPGYNFTVADADMGVENALADIRNLFTARLTSATKAERRFIEALAAIGGDDPVKRADLAAALGKTTHAISGTRARLIDKAVITEEEVGYLRFTLPGFAAFVSEAIE